MRLLSALVNIIIILISALSFIVFLFGFFNLLVNNENGRECQMTYMYEYPDFTRIHVEDNLKYPQYKLYAYSEGIYTYKIQGSKFKGIPVLFIPGNGGSYKQVRSLASITLRKAAAYKYHFNFFTVDLNEELSGLYGGVLNAQADFVNRSIYRILELYSAKSMKEPPRTVILIGHSMGGIVALKVMTNVNDSKNVDLIITLSTPHLRPAIVLDPNTEKFYSDVKSAWSPRADYLLNKTVITIGSGLNDRLVNTRLTHADYSSLHAITTGIPKVWLDTEHVVIVWCKQLIMTVIRSLFDVIDPKNRQLIENDAAIKETFHYHLIHNSGVNYKFKETYQNVIANNGKGDWIELAGDQATFELGEGTSKSLKWIMIPVSQDLINKTVIIQARNLGETNWIYFCSAISVSISKQMCEKMYPLSQYSQVAPSVLEKRREINVNVQRIYDTLPEFTHLIVKIPSDSKNVKLDVDKFDPTSRIVDVDVPNWCTFFDKIIVKSTPPGALKYKINLHNFDSVNNALSLKIKSECKNYQYYQIIATFKAPWALQSTTGYFNVQNKKSMPITVFSSKTADFTNVSSYIEVNLDTSCISEIRIKSNLIESFGQITRHYSVMLIANIGAILILILRYQLLDENCTLIVNSSILKATKPYYFLIIVQIVTIILNNWSTFEPDVNILKQESMNFTVLPVLLHMGAIGMVFVLSLALWIGMVLGGSAIQKLTLKVLCKRMFGFVRISEWMLDCMQNFSCGVACILFLLATTTAGCLALVLGTIFYFLKLVKMYEDYLESLIRLSVITLARTVKNTLFSPKKNSDANQNTTSENPENNPTTTLEPINDANQNNTSEKEENTKQLEEKDVDKVQNDENRNVSIVTDIKEHLVEDVVVVETKEERKRRIYSQEMIIKWDSSDSSEDENQEQIDAEHLTVDVPENKPANEGVASQVVEVTKQHCDKKSESVFSPLIGLHFHFTTFLIFCVVSAISIPSVLTWARNYRYSNSLAEDPSYIPAVIIFFSAVYLWDIDEPKTNLKCKNTVGYLLYALAVLSVVFATLTVYRLSYFLSIAILLVTLHQRFAPEQINVVPNELEDEDRQMEKLKLEENEQKMMKEKLE